MNESIDASAWADMYAAAPSEWAGQFGMACRRYGGATVLTLRALPHPMFNRALGFGVVGQAPMGEVVETLVRDAAPRWDVSLAPETGLEEELEALGLAPGRRLAVLARPLEAPVQPVACPFELREVTAPQAPVFADVLGAGYGTPPFLKPWNVAMVGRPGWRFYLAWEGETPVACAGLFTRGEVAMLAMAATLPGSRGRGAQSALVQRRLADAVGCRWVVAQTDDELANPSLRNLLRLGFDKIYSRTSYSKSTNL